MDKAVKYIVLAAIVLLLAGAFIGGCSWHKKYRPCPEVFTHTVILHDTVIHHIKDTVPYYIVRRDSIVYRDTVFQDIDTAAILRNFYALHYYTRTWEDSLLFAKSEDAISQNEFVDNKFSYKILRPQSITYTTVDNSISYSKYLYAGVSIPIKDIKYADLSLSYAFRRGFVGVGYSPMQNGFSLKTGLTIIKIR
jgi:hypothetical protein